MRRISCFFLCLFPPQSLIPRARASAMVCPLELKCSATGKPGALLNATEMFTKTFPQSTPSLADVNGRAATAGDAVNHTAGQASEGIFDGEAILWPQKIGFAGNMATYFQRNHIYLFIFIPYLFIPYLFIPYLFIPYLFIFIPYLFIYLYHIYFVAIFTAKPIFFWGQRIASPSKITIKDSFKFTRACQTQFSNLIHYVYLIVAQLITNIH